MYGISKMMVEDGSGVDLKEVLGGTVAMLGRQLAVRRQLGSQRFQEELRYTG